jgi:hypothetical protein
VTVISYEVLDVWSGGPVPVDVDGHTGDDRVLTRAEQHERIERLPERDRAPALDAAQLQEPEVSALRVRAIDIAFREARISNRR